MAHIDGFIKHLFEYKAEALVLRAEMPVVLVIGGEQQPITGAPLPELQVDMMLADIVPIDRLEEVRKVGKHPFDYASPAGETNVVVQRKDNGLAVFIKPAHQPAEESRPAPATTRMNPFAASAAERPAPAPSTVAVSPPTPPAAPVVAKAAPTAAAAPGAGEPVVSLREDIPPPVPGHCELDGHLRFLIDREGSDLYVCTGKAPIIRVHGDLLPIEGAKPLSEAQAEQLLFSVTPLRFRAKFRETNDVDFAYELPGVARFRANLFRDRFGIGGIFRQIPTKIATVEQLGLPRCVLDLCHLPKGLVVVTGPTGSGKSTTLAAMVDYINTHRSCHIITIEDPIEFVHEDRSCVVNQREVGAHTGGFKQALRAALREDPDIVLVGEMRDLETIAIAIETAETGHVVFGTLHTNTAASTVDRIIDQFPADRQAQIRTMLSESLRGVVAQTLCKKVGGGRIAGYEILLVTPSVANIIREGKTFQLPSIMQTGRSVGMTTMNASLLELVREGKVDAQEALDKAIQRSELMTMLEQANLAPRGRPSASTAAAVAAGKKK